jgi:UDP-N-acetylglucosamine 2-epimerase
VTLCEFGCKKLDALFGALAEFPDYQILITGVNADAGNQLVRDSIWRFAASNPDRTCVVESLGQMLYLSALAHAEIVIGNSSSALIEAPSFNIPTVNVGDRQRGRIRATSVIDSTDDQTAITQAIRRALEPAFRDRLKEAISPFGDGYAAEKIRKVLASYPLDNLLVKCFHDVNP